MKLVSIITVNYNQPDITEQLLNSVFSLNTYPNVEMIVVDNGSTINPVPKWVEKYPSVHFIRSEKNTGFAGGNNLGLRFAKGYYLFLVNNDTEITETIVGNLARILDTHPRGGMISPKILYHPSAVLQYAGYTPLHYMTARNKCIGQFEIDRGQYDQMIGKTAYAHGAAMMVRREAIDSAGLMEENFFLYYEELDWCERIKKHGFEIWVNPQAVIYHKESTTVGKQSSLKEYYMNRNRILMVRKHAPRLIYPLFMLYFICGVVPVKILRYLRANQSQLINTLGKAIWWNITNKTTSNNSYSPSHQMFKG